MPYKGGAPAIQALLAGEVQLTAMSVNTALPHIQAGKVRALGVASSKRSPALPDVPTFIESGIAFEGDSWLAIMGPPGMPADIAAKLNQEIAAALREPETQERLAKIGLVVVASPPPVDTYKLSCPSPFTASGGPFVVPQGDQFPVSAFSRDPGFPRPRTIFLFASKE